jgi:hypothetical protein
MSRWVTAGLAMMCLAALAACGTENYHFSNGFLRLHADPHPTPPNFSVCHGYGCNIQSHIALSEAEWQSVRAQFAVAAATDKEERVEAANAIALFEVLVGKRTGTAVHQRLSENQTATNPMSDPSQMDCIDESVNTWTYLTMLNRAGLLRFHAVGTNAYAGTIFTLDMRNTAVLIRKSDGALFAVDASLVDAALPPAILPLAVWAKDWPPKLADVD